MEASALRPRRVGEILDAGIKIYLARARTLMGLAAVVIVPLQLFAAVVLLSTVSHGASVPAGFANLGSQQTLTPGEASARLGATVVLLVVELVGGWLVAAAAVKAVSDAYLDQPTDIASSLRFALRRLPALAWMEILLVFGLILAFIALVIPGIWLYAAWSVAAPALLIEGCGPRRALGRSRRLVRGRWWPTAGVLLVSTIMISIVSTALQALLAAVSGLPSQPTILAAVVVSTLSTTVATIVTEPFRAAVVTVLYYDLRVRKEGYDMQLLAEQLGLPAIAVEAPPTLGPESVGRPGGPPYWPPPPGWTPEA